MTSIWIESRLSFPRCNSLQLPWCLPLLDKYSWFGALQEMLHFARGRSPGKMQKALAIGRLPGVLPGAESQANMLIANEFARALAPGKYAPDTGPGTTPGKLCL